MKLITSLEGRKSGKSGVKMKGALLLIFLLSALSLQSAETPDHRELWNSGNEKYIQGDFTSALENYLKIEELGYSSSQLTYNIGNTYFKLGENGKAILYFERTLKLDPSDGDAERNLALAKEYTLDKIESVPEFILTTWIREAGYVFSSNGWAMLSLLFAGIFALLILLFRYATTSRIRKASFFSGATALLFAIVSVMFAWNQKSDFTTHDTAIIMKPVSSVKSSPDNSGKTLFILHEGTKVKLLEQIGGWQRVELSDGRQGWIISVDIEII